MGKNKLKWQTGEPPEDELVIYEVDEENIIEKNDYQIGKNHKGRMLEGYMDKWQGWYSEDISRWVLYSDFLKVVE